MATSSPHLRPREHGAYAMLGFPLASGIALGGASAPGVAFALLVVVGFLAHEAALVVLGRLGERVRTAADRAAHTRLLGLVAMSLAAGLVFVLTAPRNALIWRRSSYWRLRSWRYTRGTSNGSGGASSRRMP